MENYVFCNMRELTLLVESKQYVSWMCKKQWQVLESHRFYINSGNLQYKANSCLPQLKAIFDSVLHQKGFQYECLKWSHDGVEATVALLCSPLSCYTCSWVWGRDTKGAVLLRGFTPRLRFSECFSNLSCRGWGWKQSLRRDGFGNAAVA